jgi:hypothetical protein
MDAIELFIAEQMMEKPMKILEAQESNEAYCGDRNDLRFGFGYFGLTICMLGAIYIAALSPGSTLGDLALMSVFP